MRHENVQFADDTISSVSTNDDEKEDEDYIPFPNVVWIIILNEFSERYAYFALRGTLDLYMRNELGLSENNAIIALHLYIAFACCCPILGAILADGHIGRYKTILYLSIVYAIGCILVAVSSIYTLGFGGAMALLVFGLGFVAIGTGGIKPCVSSLGGDQFELPQQASQLMTFFNYFYFAISLGSFLSTVITPLLRNKVDCSPSEQCYPIAFGLPAALMAFSVLIFLAAKPFYKLYEPKGKAVVGEWFGCMIHATQKKAGAKDKVDHWLDRAADKYDKPFIEDCKKTLPVLVLLMPFPMFWSLYEQQASSWIFQGAEMDGQLTTVLLLPDQMATLNTFLILVFIPVLGHAVYPLFEQINWLTNSLQKITAGGVFACLAFMAAGIVSVIIKQYDRELPSSGHGSVIIINVLRCPVTIAIKEKDANGSKPLDYFQYRQMEVDKGNVSIALTGCNSRLAHKQITSHIFPDQGVAVCYLNYYGLKCIDDDFTKDKLGRAKIRAIADRPIKTHPIILHFKSKVENHRLSLDTSKPDYEVFKRPGKYIIDDDDESEHEYLMGGIYTILVRLTQNGVKEMKVYDIGPPSKVHIVWQIPQFILITMAEALMCPTALKFAYATAPWTMKSFVTSIYLFSEALGNILVVILQLIPYLNKHRFVLFFLYAALMLVFTVLYYFVAKKKLSAENLAK